MKIILIKIGIFILNIIYFFIKLFPINKNKVTFISRQSNEVSLDFTMIAKELKQQNENIKIVFLCKKLLFIEIQNVIHYLSLVVIVRANLSGNLMMVDRSL